MDMNQHSTLMEVLHQLPDPRQARGKQHDWVLLLTLLVSALVSGMKSGHAIAQWVQEHAPTLLAHFQPQRQRLPCESTLRRALRHLDIQALETLVAAANADGPERDSAAGGIMTAQGEVIHGQAIDGKVVRGATAHGEPVLLVSRVAHDDGTTLGQMRVEPHHNAGPCQSPGWRYPRTSINGRVVQQRPMNGAWMCPKARCIGRCWGARGLHLRAVATLTWPC